MFRIDLRNESTDIIFQLKGTLCLEDTAMLRKAFWNAINQYPIKRLILDFARVPTIDSSVISLLVATKNLVGKNHGDLILVHLNGSHKQFLEQIHLFGYFHIQSDLETCLSQPSTKAP